MSLVDDIVGFLTTSSTQFTLNAGTSGGNISKQISLDGAAPDTLTAVYETAGVANAYVMSTSTGSADVAFERPSFQILSRSTSYATARSRAQTAYTLLDGLAQRNLPTSTGTLYLEVVANQAPFFLQRDGNERFIVATNYTVRKQV